MQVFDAGFNYEFTKIIFFSYGVLSSCLDRNDCSRISVTLLCPLVGHAEVATIVI